MGIRVSGYVTRTGKRVRGYTRSGNKRHTIVPVSFRGRLSTSAIPSTHRRHTVVGRPKKKARGGATRRGIVGQRAHPMQGHGKLKAGSVIAPRHRRNRAITGTSGQAVTSSKRKRKPSGVTASLRRQARGMLSQGKPAATLSARNTMGGVTNETRQRQRDKSRAKNARRIRQKR